ncbi:Uncharacterised protein [uncultured archaeon]|nr:Uncharacterised protein [uncultured archaeon]
MTAELLESMNPIEYEVLNAFLELKHRGQAKVPLKDLVTEVNKQRRSRDIPTLSPQHVFYYLKKLAERPFITKENGANISKYSLVPGVYKLNQSPPLCLCIGEFTSLLICDKVRTCHKNPSMTCVESLVAGAKQAVPTIPA